MVQATWNDAVIAESAQMIIVEGNHYFPPESINQQYFKPSDNHIVCGWKGIASYCHVEVDDKTGPNAAWYYTAPHPAVNHIAGYIVFWHGVEVRAG